MIPALVVALLACGRADPELVGQRQALDRWREGKQHLAQGEPDEAVESFEAALDKRPDDPVLRAWLAHAHASAGDLDAAVAILDGLLADYPDFAEARYNRAAYLARQGDLEASAADLQRAIEGGARTSREVLEDPDFAPHLDHPAFGFLPRQALVVAIDAPEAPVFLGNHVDVRISVLGTDGRPVSVEPEEATGPVRVGRVVENRIQSTEGPGSEITWTFEVLGPGPVVLGPLHVRADGHEATVGEVAFEAVAPEGREAPPQAPIALTTATQAGGALAVPSATWRDDHLLVKALPGDRVELSPAADPTRTFELRELGRPVWVLYRYEPASPPDRVRVLRNGRPLLDEAPRTD